MDRHRQTTIDSRMLHAIVPYVADRVWIEEVYRRDRRASMKKRRLTCKTFPHQEIYVSLDALFTGSDDESDDSSDPWDLASDSDDSSGDAATQEHCLKSNRGGGEDATTQQHCPKSSWEVAGSANQEVKLGSDSDSDADPSSRMRLGVDEETGPFVGPRQWNLGQSCGEWVSRTCPLEPQGQVLLTNVALTLRRLPGQVLRSILEHSDTPSRWNQSQSLFIRVTARLLGVSCSRVFRIFHWISRNGWSPWITVTTQPRGEDAHLRGEGAKGQTVLVTLVRAALAESIAGSSANAFVRHISRLALDGVDVGGRFHTRHFVRQAVRLGAKVLQVQDRLDMDERLGGLGIPSSFALLFDGVPVGGVTLFSRHGTVEVICVAFISAATGRIHSRFLQWAMCAAGHQGDATGQLILAVLAAPPLGFTTKVLRRRMSQIGGDGAVVRGGPARKKPGTQAADMIWFTVHPPVKPTITDDSVWADVVPRPLSRAERGCKPRGAEPRGAKRVQPDAWVHQPEVLHSATVWDKFHLQDIALTRAIARNSLAEELFVVSGLMDHMFGLGDGKLLLRTAAEMAGTSIRSGRLPGMTRKAVQLCAEPGHLLWNFKAYASGLHLREAWRAAGHDDKVSRLVDAGRRLQSVQFVSFALIFKDIMSRVVAPWVAQIQKTSLEPWVVTHCFERHVAQLTMTMHSLRWARDILRILILLRQWSPERDIAELTKAFFYASPSAILPVTCLESRPRGESSPHARDVSRPRVEPSRRYRWPEGLEYGQRYFFIGSAWAASVVGQELFCPAAASVPCGRALPSFLLALNDMLHLQRSGIPKFHGTDLLCVLLQPWQLQSRLVGPHCQCSFLKKGKTGRKVKLKGMRRSVKLPLWAFQNDRLILDGPIDSGISATNGCPEPPPIRWRWLSASDVKVPPGVRPEDRFRNKIRIIDGGYCSACFLPPLLSQLFSELDSSIAGAIKFVLELLKQEKQLFGLEGMNAGMSEAHRLMAVCFDWGRLVNTGPRVEDAKAFSDLCKLLMPYLRHTLWPLPEQFPEVIARWPGNQ